MECNKNFGCLARQKKTLSDRYHQRLLHYLLILLILPTQGMTTEICSGQLGDIHDTVFDTGGIDTCTVNESIMVGPSVTVVSGSGLGLYALTTSVSELSVEQGATFMVSITNPANLQLVNDTGITTCSDGISNGLSCPVVNFPAQDAEDGRDVTVSSNADGHAGFSFTKLDASGSPLAASTVAWSCVKDNLTGLIWENKTDDGGLRDKDNTYSWYNTDSSVNGGSAGHSDNGICTVSDCDTQAYVNAVNSQHLCGSADWRMPRIKELENLSSLDRYAPAIDTDYFPNTVIGQLDFYWSATSDAEFSTRAWYLVSYNGLSISNEVKSTDRFVRLVRDGQ